MKRVNAAISPSKRTEEEGLSLVIDAQQKKLKPTKQEAIKSLVSLNVFKPLRRNSEKMSRNNKSSHHANYALNRVITTLISNGPPSDVRRPPFQKPGLDSTDIAPLHQGSTAPKNQKSPSLTRRRPSVERCPMCHISL